MPGLKMKTVSLRIIDDESKRGCWGKRGFHDAVFENIINVLLITR